MKKIYLKPDMKVMNMLSAEILAGSGEESGNVTTVDGGDTGITGPVQGGDGKGPSAPRTEQFNIWEE